MRALILFVVACGGAAPVPSHLVEPPASPAAPASPAPPASPGSPAASEETFTGTLTEVRFGCAVDASCDLVVDGTRRVHFGHDTRRAGPTTWGNTEQIFALMEAPDHGVGRRVEVFAATVPGGGYTLEGKAAYYIKVLP